MIIKRQERSFKQPATPTINPKAKKVIGEKQKEVLKEWFFEHFDAPYPNLTTQRALARAAGLKHKQVVNWFMNVRKRVWIPTLNSRDASSKQEAFNLVRIRLEESVLPCANAPEPIPESSLQEPSPPTSHETSTDVNPKSMKINLKRLTKKLESKRV